MFSRAVCGVATAMYSASAVISDCDSVPGNRAVVLCASSLLGVHTVILDSGKVSYSSSS